MRAKLLLVTGTVLVVILAGLLAYLRPFDQLASDAPPKEQLTFERVYLEDRGIHLTLTVEASEPIRIAQVQIDGAYRKFEVLPDKAVGHLGKIRVFIPYPWVAGEAHKITLLTASGATFEHTIEAAASAPGKTWRDWVLLALVGLVVGFVPIVIGYLFMPALNQTRWGRPFALALTVGLLVFLLLDTMSEGLEVASEAAQALNTKILVWALAFFSCIGLAAFARRHGHAPTTKELAGYIALGIGIHNLAEGLAIGAAFTAGELALASFLILGFALHNVTEGVAIAAPLEERDYSLARLIMLAIIGGGLAIPGTIIGASAATPFYQALAFAIGAGAIAQVIFEVSLSFLTEQELDNAARPVRWYSAPVVTGLLAGFAIMYATSLLIT